MKRTRKILALLLCIVMCLSLFPVSAFAAEEEPAEVVTDEATVPEVTDDAQGEEAGEPADPADPATPADGEGTGEENGTDTDPVDPTDPADGTDSNGGENTDPADPADGTDPADEPTDGEDAEKTEETEEEEEEQAELPYGFVGMPEGYEFSKAELAAKRALTEMGILDSLNSGVRFVEGKLLLTTSSREYAELAAAAYNAELKSFNGHLAVLLLREATVAQAVEAAADMELPLPAVEPVWIMKKDPVIRSGGVRSDVEAQGIFDPLTWETWFEYEGEDADTYLSNPNSGEYQYQHDMVNSYEAWGVTTGAVKHSVTVAVLDTGFDLGHEDLKGTFLPGYDTVDDDADPWYEYTDPDSDLPEQHGTHCAGIIAANMGNGMYGAGIAPDVSIVPVRVIMDGDNPYYTIINGIYYAADYGGVDIISMSIGGLGYSFAMQEALDYAYERGITVIVSMGNDATNVKSYPAACDHVVAVAAVDAAGVRAGYSNYGAWCDISAPGSAVWSTVPEDGMECWDGTSMACPVVAGVAALYMSVYGNPGPAEMERILKSSVSKSAGAGMGTGIVDASKLFNGEKKAPIVELYDYDYNTEDFRRVTDGKVTQSGYILVKSGSGYTPENASFLFTTDGKNPAVKNGDPVAGAWMVDAGTYDSDLESFIFPLNGLAIGTKVTLKFLEVSGVGVPSKINTTKFQITAPGLDVLIANAQVAIEAPESVAAGKTITLKAEVFSTFEGPDGETMYSSLPNQKVAWSLDGSPAGVTIDAKSGKLIVGGEAQGTEFTVIAASTAYSGVTGTAVMKVNKVQPVGRIELRQGSVAVTSVTAYAGYSDQAVEVLVWDANGNPMDPAGVDLKWTSSKPAVAGAFYDDEGRCFIYANSKGAANLKLSAMDGTGVSAALKVTVVNPAESITVTGPTSIEPGKTGKYKAAIAPKDAGNKKVTWQLLDEEGSALPNNCGIRIDPVTGAVTVDSSAAEGTVFQVCAVPTVGPFETLNSCTVIVSRKATGIKWYSEAPVSYLRDKKGNISGITLYTVDLPGTDEKTENYVSGSVRREGVGSDYMHDGITVTNKTPAVADVSYSDGAFEITARKAGTTVLTFTANDGSGKKSTMTVQVLTPVSSMTVKSKNAAAFNSDDTYFIGLGKSIQNTVTFGDTYGKPTNTKVTWSYKTYGVWFDDDGYVEDQWELGPYNCISVSPSGKLTVKKTFGSVWYDISYDILIEVIATSTDGTKVSDSVFYYVTALPTKIKPASKSITVSISAWHDAEMGDEECGWMPISMNGYWTSYAVSSNKPDVAGAIVDGGGILVIPGTKTGTAKITVKTVDGSNKSCSFTVKVVP